MKPSELIVLLPCYSLEDLSLDRSATEAEEILASWCGLYHPWLIAAAEKVPRWVSAEMAPDEPGPALIAVPSSCEALLPARWIDRAIEAGARVAESPHDHRAVLQAAVGPDDKTPAGQPPEIEPALAANFYALGFCHLQVELLTRQLRYMSNLDEDQFARKTVAAAQAALQGDEEETGDQLRSAFDLLTEAREYFYPVEAHLLDLTLVAPTTLGDSLRRELAGGTPRNVLISGELVETLAREEPQSLAALREGLEAQRVSLVGGGYREEPLGMLTHEAILADLRKGLATYQRHLGHRPVIYGRRRAGLTPLLPQILQGLGFVGAVHFTLDEGRFPGSNQSKIRWQGLGGKPLEALSRVPFDATGPENFLRLPEKLGDAMDLDHAASAVLAHWAGQSSPWYDDLQRMTDFSPVLGRFNTLDQYFSDTELAGQIKQFSADQYRTPYLMKAVQRAEADPLSRWVRLYRAATVAEATQTLAALARAAGGAGQDDPNRPAAPPHRWPELLEALSKPDPTGPDEPTAPDEPGQAASARDRTSASGPGLPSEESARLAEAASRLADVLGKPSASAQGQGREQGPAGALVLNPWAFTLQQQVDTSRLDRLPAVEGPVRWAAETPRGKQAVVEVPGLGFAWLAAAPSTPSADAAAGPAEKQPRRQGLVARLLKRKPPTEPPLAELGEEGCVLQNDYFRIKMNPHAGTIQSIYDYRSRGNRLAQQIAFRSPAAAGPEAGAEAEKAYSIMAVDSMHVSVEGPERGEVVSRGRLVSREGKRVADFQQMTRVRRGSRLIELDIEIDPQDLPSGNPWQSYYAARFAWDDATADTLRNAGPASVPCDAPQIEAPCFFDIRGEKTQTTILTGGLPFHRRVGLRKLDSLLIVAGERSRRFRLGIGVDLDYPMHGAAPWLLPGPLVVSSAAGPPMASGWLFHVDARNVLATHWEPLLDGERCEGFRVRLLETQGRRAITALRCVRRPAAARQTDFLGQTIADLPVRDDHVTMELKSHQWIQVEVRWK
jgi:alpha-mannosidase